MNQAISIETKNPYAACVAKSRRIRWDIDSDVLRGRHFDTAQKFLPDGLSGVHRLEFLSPDEQRLLSQIQGRTYANMFGMVERFIGAKMLDLSRAHWLGDQAALEALVRVTDEELKHQALFRRIEAMMAAVMPPGYEFAHDANAVAGAVLAAHDWAVLALSCHIELFTQDHYLQSLSAGADLSEIFRDVFRFHWQEESQHAVVDELEWKRVHAAMSPGDVDLALDELIQLIYAVDAVLQMQAQADCRYFLRASARATSGEQSSRLATVVLQAYRWQYLVSGFLNVRFGKLLGEMLSTEQLLRLEAATRPLIDTSE